MDALKLFLAFIIFFHFSCFLVLAQEHPISCPKDFQCRKLGHLHYPFTNVSIPDCGLLLVKCYPPSSPYPKIQFDNSDQILDAITMVSDSIIKLKDPQFQRLLENKSCNTFYYQINLPNSSSVSFKIASNMTILFRCIDSSSSSAYFSKDRFGMFSSNGYKNFTSCVGIQIFYRNPTYYHRLTPPSNEFPPPQGCIAIHYPLSPWNDSTASKEIDPFELLSSEFILEWQLNKKDKSRIVIVSVAAAGGFLIIAISIFLWFCRKRIEDPPSFVHSRSDFASQSSYLGITIFSYAELEEITNNFDASNELGDGGYGTVYYGKLGDGREVAVKRLYEHNFKRMEQFINEIQILNRLKHKNLVSLHGCTSRHSRELLLVYEYIPNGTLADHLHGDKAKYRLLTWPMRMNIAIQTAGALAYLHASDIIHRDVKTPNILLDHNFQVKVADFGLSRLFPDDVKVTHISTAPQGTPGYLDPEYHHCYQLTDKSDVYSFGVVLIELISSLPAVDMSRKRHEINLVDLAINKIQRCVFHEVIDKSLGFDSDYEVLRMTTSVAELAFLCLQMEKEMRPTMAEVLETLKAIRDYMQIFEDTTETDAKESRSRSKMLPFSPESEDAVLLKDPKVLSSPISVTELCISSSFSSTNRSNT